MDDMTRHRTRILPLILWCVCGVLPVVMADEQPAIKMGAQDYIEYQPGTLPLIIAAPHGGTLRPDGIPNRSFGRVAQDSFTQEQARVLADQLEKQYGARPHLVICRLHRMKVDCNRELTEAAQGDPVAERAWNDFQGFIKEAREAVLRRHGEGLFIDLHGHRHPEARVELGYLLTRDDLAVSDAELDANGGFRKKASFRTLAGRTTASFADLVRGGTSLGALLETRGFPSIPSPVSAAPKEGEEYFHGGYNTSTHGSRNGGSICGLQIECPFKGVRDREENREKFAIALAQSLGQWWRAHYGRPLSPKPAAASTSPSQ